MTYSTEQTNDIGEHLHVEVYGTMHDVIIREPFIHV